MDHVITHEALASKYDIDYSDGIKPAIQVLLKESFSPFELPDGDPVFEQTRPLLFHLNDGTQGILLPPLTSNYIGNIHAAAEAYRHIAYKRNEIFVEKYGWNITNRVELSKLDANKMPYDSIIAHLLFSGNTNQLELDSYDFNDPTIPNNRNHPAQTLFVVDRDLELIASARIIKPVDTLIPPRKILDASVATILHRQEIEKLTADNSEDDILDLKKYLIHLLSESGLPAYDIFLNKINPDSIDIKTVLFLAESVSSSMEISRKFVLGNIKNMRANLTRLHGIVTEIAIKTGKPNLVFEMGEKEKAIYEKLNIPLTTLPFSENDELNFIAISNIEKGLLIASKKDISLLPSQTGSHSMFA